MSAVPDLWCPHCGLHLSRLPVTVQVSVGTVEHGGLFCPACTGLVPLQDTMIHAGIFVRAGRLYRWGGGRDAAWLRVGELLLRFQQVESLDLRQVCFPAVPRLLLEGGQVCRDLLPIRPEFADLVDGVEGAPVISGDAYRVTMRLRGQAAPVVVERPLVPGPDAPVGGLRVSLWPRVPYAQWRLFLLGAWWQGEGRLGSAQLHIAPVYAHGEAPPVVPLHIHDGQRSAIRRLLGRPSHVALTLRVDERLEAGGCLPVEPARQSLEPVTGRLVLGVDFGTSNSYLAYKVADDDDLLAADAIRPVPWADRDLVLLAGAPRHGGSEAPDIWPPLQGFHPARSTFPSVLLTRRPAASLDPDADGWVLGQDFGLLAVGAELPEPGYPQRDHLVTHLKWGARTPAGPLPSQAARQRYLEALLLLALANLMAEERVHAREVRVRWSYPAVFEHRNRLESQQQAFHAACERLQRWTGVAVHAVRGSNEAMVASYGTTHQEATDVLYVDVGGATADVLFARYLPGSITQAGHLGIGEAVLPIHALSSFRFAGEDYTRMLQRGGFLDPAYEGDAFVRAVRVTPRLDQEFAKRCFAASRRNPAHSRSTMFYMYLVEYMARLIAARLLDGSELRPEGDTYVVSVSLLGNGWGFLGLTANRPHGFIQGQLEERVRALCQAEASDAPEGCAFRRGLPFTIRCERSDDVLPKQVVAHGLLQEDAQERKSRLVSLGILGLSTRVRQRYPWYLPLLPCFDPQDPRLAGYRDLSSAPRPQWLPQDDPGFAPNLPTLHDVDPGLRRSYERLIREAMPVSPNDWFGRNALEVVLEYVIRPNLHRISRVSYT